MENKVSFYIASLVITSLLINDCYAEIISKTDSGESACVKYQSPKTRKVVIDFILNPLSPSFKRIGISEKYITNRFGKYTIKSSKNYMSAYSVPGETYEIQSEVWAFSGIDLKIEKMISSPKSEKKPYWIDKLVITSDNHALRSPIKLGSSIDHIQCHLGKSLNESVKEDGKLEYSTVGVKEYGDLTIYLDSSNKANKIVFEYFSD